MRVSHTLTRLIRGLGLAVAITTATLCGPVAAADYSEDFSTGKPEEMFQGRLKIGAGESWTAEVTKGTYFLINRESPGAVEIITLPEQASPSGAVKMSVSVLGQFEGERSGAGLFFGGAGGTGFAFVVTPSGGYALYRVEENGTLEPLSRGTNAAIRPAAVNRLSVDIAEKRASLLVNDEEVYAHAAGEGAALTGSVGLIAIDVGAYSFDDFTMASE